MPFGDGTGPMGLGPMTGRAAGYCAGYVVPGYMSPVPGGGFRGAGRGFGRRGWSRGGRGWRHRFYATGLPGWVRAGWGWPAWGAPAPFAAYAPPYGSPPTGAAGPVGFPGVPPMTPEQETDALKGQAEYFEEALEGIRKRVSELEAEQKAK